MPQMAPLGWLSLYLMFSVVLILFCTVNYYMFIPPAPSQNKSSKLMKNSFNWKW